MTQLQSILITVYHFYVEFVFLRSCFSLICFDSVSIWIVNIFVKVAFLKRSPSILEALAWNDRHSISNVLCNMSNKTEIIANGMEYIKYGQSL